VCGETATSHLEAIELDQLSTSAVFLDEGGTDYRSTVELTEWVPSVGEKKSLRGHLQFRTLKIDSENDSDFYLRLINTKRNKYRRIAAKYTVDKKPYVMGSAKDMRIQIESSDEKGFQINAVSYEGNYNSRSKKV